ncbi:MAG TPA: glycerol-3-phosphate 1-O-acyltransferase PlsY [Bacteroidia bacterium]|nr:glycerol-3-phosphate 1-O-acyltransferase PlsY [Bacteroidia bacterium]
MEVLLLLIVAYLLGSIPTSVWIGKYFYGIDIREHGSGNAGATNTFRVLGKKPGIIVLLIDIIKGSLAVSLSYIFEDSLPANEFVDIEIGLAIAAVFGHIFPVFAGFRGGKGVATLLGATVIITPISCAFALVVFLIVLFSTRYVSLSSMLAGISYPIILHFILNNQQKTLTIYSILIAVLLIITHRKNIRRLLSKTESKIVLAKSKA